MVTREMIVEGYRKGMGKLSKLLIGVDLWDPENLDDELVDFGVYENPPADAPWYVKFFWDPEEECAKAAERRALSKNAVAESSFGGDHESDVLDFQKRLNALRAKKDLVFESKKSV